VRAIRTGTNLGTIKVRKNNEDYLGDWESENVIRQ